MNEFPWPTQSLTTEIHPKQILGSLDKLIIATVPYFHRPPTVLCFLDLPFEICVIQLVILYLDGQALDSAISGGLLGNSPALQNAIHFET